MAIRLQITSPTFIGTAEFHVPGEKQKEKVKFVFKYYTKKQLAKIQSEMRGKSDVETIMMIVANWIDENPDGEATPFNEENLALFLDTYHDAPNVIVNAYYDELLGARLGN